MWENLSVELNAYGAGPVKSSGEWQTTFRAWKHQIRHKARTIKKHGNETGGGPASSKQLSDVEERALFLWGKEVVGNGLDIGEVGLGNIDDRDSTLVVEFIDENTEPIITPSSSTQQHQSAAIQTPQRKQSAAKNSRVTGTAKTRMINMFKESDDKIADAILNLAERIGDAAIVMGKGNELVAKVIENQQTILTLLLEKTMLR